MKNWRHVQSNSRVQIKYDSDIKVICYYERNIVTKGGNGGCHSMFTSFLKIL